VQQAVDNVVAILPALFFLCAAVPLADLLGELGFFDALTARIVRRFDPLPVWTLWVLATVTVAVLNLDAAIVLLTPLFIRLARQAERDVLSLALIPLLLACLASSFLPVSNLTTLIVVARFDLSAADVLVHLAPAGLLACVVGWLVYRRRYDRVLHLHRTDAASDRSALRIGWIIITGLLIGFVAGPLVHIDPWMTAFAADVVLAIIVRRLPWRSVPLLTALGVAACTATVAVVIPTDALTSALEADGPVALGGLVLAGTAAANVVDNLPALFIALDATSSMTHGQWAWLAGVNVGAVLLPWGALANLLWLRVYRAEGGRITLAGYVRSVFPIAVPATLAMAVALAASSPWWP